MKAFIKEAWDRINSPTPAFFKKWQKIGGGLALGSGSIIAGYASNPHPPTHVIAICTHVAVVGGAIAAIASFAIKPPEDSKGGNV